MKELYTEIEISASEEAVWQILVDLERFPEWNPFITLAEGEVKEGSRLRVRIEPPGGAAMTFKPMVRRVVRNREFRWQGRFLVPGLFDGVHSFEILPTDRRRVRFVQRETFRGLLVPLLWWSMERSTKQGFLEMNAALKQRAETSVGSGINT
jgi:hypothetical protein